MSTIKIPRHLLPDFVENLRWEARKNAALLDLAKRKIDKYVNWEGLLEHYSTFFHEDLPNDIIFRRFFDEYKSLCEQTELQGQKYLDLSSDLYREISKLSNVE